MAMWQRRKLEGAIENHRTRRAGDWKPLRCPSEMAADVCRDRADS